MIPSLLANSTTPLLQKMAEFGERRQTVLASNIGHIDTPGYEMRDLPVEKFQAAMKAYFRDQQQPLPTAVPGDRLAPDDLPTRSPRGLDEYLTADLFLPQSSKDASVTAQDGNNRSIENQVTEMTKNMMQQQFAIELFNNQLKQLEMIISERV